MSLGLVLNLILILSGLGILIVFLRRLPEAVAGAAQRSEAKISELTAETIQPETSGQIFKRAWKAVTKKVWHFMLEAKDLKQGQALATKFVEVREVEKVFNIGALSILKKGQRLLAAGDYEGAEQAFIDAIKKNPHEFEAYEGLARIYSHQKKFDEVRQLLEYLVKHNPDNDRYLTQLGAALIKQRRFREAIEAYSRALEINDLVPVRYVNIALCYDALKSFAEARQNFQKALDLDPANVQYLLLLVDSILKHGQVTEALRLLEKGAEINPDDPQITEKLIELQTAVPR